MLTPLDRMNATARPQHEPCTRHHCMPCTLQMHALQLSWCALRFGDLALYTFLNKLNTFKSPFVISLRSWGG